jgi:two-component system chemotaxis response regulator CheB
MCVKNAEAGEILKAGTVYLAPCDKHMLINKDLSLTMTGGHRIRHQRSSANPLFESAAKIFGKRAIGIVLTGGDSDGTDGVQAIHQHGGTVIVQDPASCDAPDMPRSALGTGTVSRVLHVNEIGPAIGELVLGSDSH